MNVVNPIVNLGQVVFLPLPTAPRLLFVGSLVRGKGVDLLLRAVARLNSRFELDIVGEGKSRRKLEKLASALGVSDCTHFWGWQDHSRLADFYRRSRIVVVPSCWPEPFGLVGQEAMHFSRPVVAFEVGGITEWCHNGVTGITVPEQNVDAFAAALDRLLSNNTLAETMGRQGFRIAAEKYRFDAVIKKIERCFKKVVSNVCF